MIKILKRITAFTLAFIMALGLTPLLPISTVLAANEAFTITTDDNVNNVYTLNFRFTRPADSPNLVSGSLGYRIYYRNLTNGETTYSSYFLAALTTTASGQLESITEQMTLVPGSIYTFEVRTHYYDLISGNQTAAGSVVARFSALTNIKVEAVGEGNAMTVTWDLPSLPNNGVMFDQYRIYYANIAGNGQELTYNLIPKAVSVSDITMVNGRATYTYSDSGYDVGRLYAVRIEPVMNGEERAALARLLTIPGYGDYHFRSDTTVHYLTDKAYIRPSLTLQVTSLTSIKIDWGSGLSDAPLSSYITRLTVYKHVVDENGNEQTNVVVNIEGLDNNRPTYAEDNARPQSGTVTYWIEVVYSNIKYLAENQTMVGGYSVTVTSLPAKYDPGAVEFEPFRPDIYEISDNGASPFSLDITWKAFHRNAYTALEKSEADVNGKYLEKAVTYLVAITDDPDNFEYMGTAQSYVFNGTSLTAIYHDTLPYYKMNFSNYYTRNSNGSLVEAVYTQNKIYYVRITAVRMATGETSLEAFDSHYIMPIDKIPVQPSMIAKPPLRIKSVDGIDAVDEQSITVEWDEQWFEIYVPGDEVVDPANPSVDDPNKVNQSWYSKAAIVNGKIMVENKNNLYTIDDEDNFLVTSVIQSSDGTINKAATRAKIKKLLEDAGITNPADTALRMIDITGASYKIHVAEYDTIAQYGYGDYYDDLSLAATTMEWENITRTATGAITREYKVTKAHNPAANPLNPSTPYVVFLRPYFSSAEGDLMAYYPSYVTATTLADRGPVDITPVVPILEPVSVTDTSVTVRWSYSSELRYELRIDEYYKNYPGGGRAILDEDIRANGTLENDASTGKLYMVYTIYKLFPDTMYYIWIRSSANNSDGLVISDWSNAIEMTTSDIEAPDPPRGLGLASDYGVHVYNQENGTAYLPSDYEYLIIEWMRITADINNTDGSAAGGVEGSSLAEYLANPLVSQSYMVKFNELVANRVYYVRAKTRLTIAKTSDGTTQRSYSYIVELSINAGFTDAVEIEVPIAGDTGIGVYKDSEWVQVALVTERSDSEYDGDKDANLYPLPNTDFEIIYDSKTDTLTYRFRSNEKDADGNHDNQVDERFISRLVANKTFEYALDLTKYGSRTPLNRVVEFPYTIIAAFNERKIDLKIKADNFTVVIPYGSLLTTEVLSLSNLNKSARVRITINQNPGGIVATTETNYISVPQRLSATLATTGKTISIVNFVKPLRMNLSVSGKYIEGATNIGAYVQDGNTAGWQRVGASFDTITQSLNFTSQKSASYAAIGIITPGALAGETLNSLYSANAKLSITDLGTYNETMTIHASQFNQITVAILRDSPTVSTNTAMATEDYQALVKAQLLVSGATVSREVGISTLVKLFEVKTKYPVTGYPALAETSYTDIASADKQYQTALLKAVDLGFYRTGSANPKGNLTFGDLMHILDILLNT